MKDKIIYQNKGNILMNNKYFGFNDDDLVFLFGKNKNKAMKSLEALSKTL